MTRTNHTGQKNLDYFVDGHCISAYSAEDARAEVRHLYNHEAEVVRYWTPEDQATLDGIDTPIEQTWTTEELRRDFSVEGFSMGYVVVRRKSDNALGSLQFERRGDERIYFGWVAN